MAIDGQKLARTTQDASVDELTVNDLRLIALDGATPSSQRPVPVQVPRAKATELLPGVEVTEFEATLPIEIYAELFKDRR